MEPRGNNLMAGVNSVDCCDVVLRDGSTVTFRAAAETDVPALEQFFAGLSTDSLYKRFMGLPRLDAARIRSQVAEGTDAVVLIAILADRIVALAGYYPERSLPHRAEVAFAIADALQGRGIATRLLERLAERARERDIRCFDAEVKSDNRKMLDVFFDSGFAVTHRSESGVTHVVLSLEPSVAFSDKAASRARAAATASMHAFFEPSSVAVIGASRRRGRIGSEILHNLQTAGFTGTLNAVHPTATEIRGMSGISFGRRHSWSRGPRHRRRPVTRRTRRRR